MKVLVDAHKGNMMEEATMISLVKNVAETLESEEHTSELQSHHDLVCRLLLEKKKKN